ncbi:hypothetical protein ACWC9S_19530 [Streptomyces xiamenensis]
MAVLVWLLIPVAGGLVAGVWGTWATRRQTGVGGIADAAGVRRYDRFRSAMERSPIPVSTFRPASAERAPADG